MAKAMVAGSRGHYWDSSMGTCLVPQAAPREGVAEHRHPPGFICLSPLPASLSEKWELSHFKGIPRTGYSGETEVYLSLLLTPPSFLSPVPILSSRAILSGEGIEPQM